MLGLLFTLAFKGNRPKFKKKKKKLNCSITWTILLSHANQEIFVVNLKEKRFDTLCSTEIVSLGNLVTFDSTVKFGDIFLSFLVSLIHCILLRKTITHERKGLLFLILLNCMNNCCCYTLFSIQDFKYSWKHIYCFFHWYIMIISIFHFS